MFSIYTIHSSSLSYSSFFIYFFLLMFHSYDFISFCCSIDFGVALLMGYGEIDKYLFDFILYYFVGWKLRVWLNPQMYFKIFFGYAEKIYTHLFFLMFYLYNVIWVFVHFVWMILCFFIRFGLIYDFIVLLIPYCKSFNYFLKLKAGR